ncbi:MAG TPA: sulfotransferase [Blastocatellia bacterium]|nr:sulfotransferase [Blastocatellia bacterium]
MQKDFPKTHEQRHDPRYSKVFILSPPRTGSTLLRYIIDTHPSICCPAELNLGRVCADLFWAAYYSVAQSRSANEIERTKLAAIEVRTTVNNLMNSYASLKNKPIWCEKSPSNLEYVDCINAAFPDAAFVCLYRNCMDYVYSCMENNRLGFMEEVWPYVQRSPKNLPEAMAESWVAQTEKLMAFEQANPARCFRITYESLVFSSSETLGQLFAFLGLKWDEDMMQRVFKTRHDAGDGDLTVEFHDKIHSRAIGRGSTIRRAAIPGPLLEKINSLLTGLGYPIIGADWDSTPSPYIPASAVAAASSAKDASEIFTVFLPRQMEHQGEALSRIRGKIQFVVSGSNHAVWLIDLTKTPPAITAGGADADCVIKLVDTDLVKITAGQLSPWECFMQGKLQIAGNVEMGVEFGQTVFGT